MARKKGGGALSQAAGVMGKAGGKYGGLARARSLSGSEKKSIAKMGGDAKARKGKRGGSA